MGTLPPSHAEVGGAVLHELDLIQIARGQSASPLRTLVRERLRLLLVVVGAVLVCRQVDLFNSWFGFCGLLLLVAGLTAPRDRSKERLDALVELLEAAGHLVPGRRR